MASIAIIVNDAGKPLNVVGDVGGRLDKVYTLDVLKKECTVVFTPMSMEDALVDGWIKEAIGSWELKD